MSEHRLVDGETWAKSQVDAAAAGLLLLPERKRGRKAEPSVKIRGVGFRPRPNGEAIGPTGEPGEWFACFVDATGLIHRERAGTKSQAKALYQRRKSEVRQGRHFPESMRKVQAVTLAAVCESYLAALAVNGRDPRGQVKTRLAEVQAILGDVAAASIRPQDIETLKAKLAETPARGRKDPEDPKKERPRTPASVNRYLQDTRAAFFLAKRNALLDANPVADVKLLREDNKRVREVSPVEEHAILGALAPETRRFHTDIRPMVRLLLETGLRAGEACGLTWGDVDIKAEVATLRKTKAGKVQHAPLSGAALAILRDIGPQGDGYVFGWPDGRPWTSGYLTHAFHKATIAAGVADVHVHDLRHTAACRWLRAGVGIYTVSKLLRHASVAMSERYAHLSQADLKAAINSVQLTPVLTPGKR